MTAKRGACIVIEGTDGSGKGTQFQLLKDRLTQAGYRVEAFDFPRYDEPSSYFVTQYLNGKYGSAEEVGPYTASLFYALDRYEAAQRLRQAIESGSVVLCNRFTGSSMAHQGTKFRNPEERRGYFIWLDNLEFEMLRIPRPDISFILRVPPDITEVLMDTKAPRTYTEHTRDLHEADKQHQQRAAEVYDDLAQLFPRDFQRIDCVRNEQLLDVETIHTMLWEKILPLLPQPDQLEMPMPAAADTTPVATASSRESHSTPDTAADPSSESNPTPEAAITNINGGVYAFTAAVSPEITAAVVASLSQGGGILSTRILQEFADAARRDNEVLRRSIQSYGDDSVQQLVSSHVVVPSASSLLAAVIERGRLATYVEPRQRRLRYEQKDHNGLYRYYMPLELEGDIAVQYRTHIDRIFDTYSSILPVLTAHLQERSGVPPQGRSAEWQAAMQQEAREILQGILPLATTTTVAIYGSAQALEHLIIRLAAHTLPEARTTGAALLAELRKTIPAFMESTDRPDRGGSVSAYRHNLHNSLAQLAAAHLQPAHAAESTAVQLTTVWPRNELDLVPDMLYDHANLPLRDLQAEVTRWPYARKLMTFEAYMGERLSRHERPGRALEKATYTWDLVCEYSTLHDLCRHRMVQNLAVQPLTPRHGYEIPDSVEAAGLGDEYEACFDTSLALYSLLQQAGHTEAAQYAVLRGHKQRWQVTYNAREAFHIHELRTSPYSTASVRLFVEQLHAKLAEVHPLLAEAMQFVGQAENPDLNRLAADRYTQFKASQTPPGPTAH